MFLEELVSLDIALSMYLNFVDIEMILQRSEGQANVEITPFMDKMMPPYVRIGSYGVPIMNHSQITYKYVGFPCSDNPSQMIIF